MLAAENLDQKRDVLRLGVLGFARWNFDSEVFSCMLVLYSIYYANGSLIKLAIVTVLVWLLDLPSYLILNVKLIAA